jgi:hypothetical protein
MGSRGSAPGRSRKATRSRPHLLARFPRGGIETLALGKETTVKELVRYLLENMYLDFQGEISLDTLRQYLRSDDSREARQLLQKLIEDKGVDELLLTLADCLKDHLRTGINEDVVREQLQLYSES